MYGIEIEQVKEANTPEEMRSEINRLRMHDPLVRQAMDMTDYNGMNAEDKYTVLSYIALKQLNEFKQRQLEFMAAHPAQNIIYKNGP